MAIVTRVVHWPIGTNLNGARHVTLDTELERLQFGLGLPATCERRGRFSLITGWMDPQLVRTGSIINELQWQLFSW